MDFTAAICRYCAFEFCEGAEAAGEAVGAALVSVLEFSDAGGVIVEEEGAEFVSVLVEVSDMGPSVGVPVEGVELEVAEVDVLVSLEVVGVTGGVAFVALLVSAVVVAGVSLGRLHPLKEKARMSMEAVTPNREVVKGFIRFCGFRVIESPPDEKRFQRSQ